MLTLKDRMTRTVITAREADSLLDAQRLMIRNNVKRIVVVDYKNTPIGIITQKDMVRGLVTGSPKPLQEIPIRSFMTKDPISIETNADVKKAARTMISKGISSIVVVDKIGKIAGIVTETDIAYYLSDIPEAGMPVKRFMSKDPVTIGEYHSIFAAAHVMSQRGFTRLIVVDKKDKPVGIITLSDLVSISALLRSQDRPLNISVVVKGALIPSRMLPILLVKNVMTADPFVINQNADITDIARLMVRHGISGLPVVDEKGKLAGIITKTDLVKAVAKIR